MKIKEMREKDVNVLNDELAGKRRHLFDLRAQAVTQKLEKSSQLRSTRREIAQILTVLQQRQAEPSK